MPVPMRHRVSHFVDVVPVFGGAVLLLMDSPMWDDTLFERVEQILSGRLPRAFLLAGGTMGGVWGPSPVPVSPAGFEPATRWVEAVRSDPLSYEGGTPIPRKRMEAGMADWISPPTPRTTGHL